MTTQEKRTIVMRAMQEYMSRPGKLFHANDILDGAQSRTRENISIEFVFETIEKCLAKQPFTGKKLEQVRANADDFLKFV